MPAPRRLAAAARPTIAALVALAACATPRAAPVVPAAVGPAAAPEAADARAAAVARAVARDLLATANLPGLSVAVSRDGVLRYAEGFGYADVEARRPATPATRFRAASVSKLLTATALARLAQAGRIDLDAPVQRYVPRYAPRYAPLAAPAAGGPAARPVTARLLAGHLGGVAHYTAADRIEPRFYATVDDALGVFAHVPPVGAPGGAYHYSTHGYTLLSAAIEGAAGRPFLDVLEREVLAPLGMRATGPDLRARPSPETAALYEMRQGAPVRVAAPEDPSYKWGGGGLLTTPSDLVRLGAGYFGVGDVGQGPGGFLRPDVVAAAFASQRLASGEETGVGLGWRRSADMDGRRVVEHAGGMEGARSVLVLFPAERLAVAVMTNASWSSAIEETAHLLALPFLARADAPADAPAVPAADAAVTVTLAADSGPPRRVPGRLRLAGGGGTLAFAPADGRERAYPLVHLGRGGTYALVQPDGAFHLTVERAGGAVRGRAVRYWTLLRESPAGRAPFLTFEGRLPGDA